MNNGDDLYVDNLFVDVGPVSLAGGTPPNLVTTTHNIDLRSSRSMTVTFQVIVDDPVPPGQTTVVNTVNVTSDEQLTALQDTVTDYLPVPPVIAKAFLPTSIPVDGTSVLTFTITNPPANTVDLEGVAFTDALPQAYKCGSPNTTTANCGTPTFAPAGGDTTLTLSAGTITPSGTCTVSVDVTGTTGGRRTTRRGM